MEFGVAGGNGLLALEQLGHRGRVRLRDPVDVFGFDTGAGLPTPEDHPADMPNLSAEGLFEMKFDKLQARLKKAKLILGPVNETVPKFVQSGCAPLAFASFDVDFYSSTTHALRILDADQKMLLPRVYCYFDDILGYTFGDHVGERLAIAEFNAAHERRKLSPIHGIRYYVPKRFQNRMREKYYMAHIFDHELYNRHDGSIPKDTNDLDLRGA